jgi:hypothetical protein
MRDTIWHWANGRIGNSCLIADANIAYSKPDSTGTARAKKFKGDTLRVGYVKGNPNIDSITGPLVGKRKWEIDTIVTLAGRTMQSGGASGSGIVSVCGNWTWTADQKAAFGCVDYEAGEASAQSSSLGGLSLVSFSKNVAAGSYPGMGLLSFSENDYTGKGSFDLRAIKHNGAGAQTAHGATAKILTLYNNTTQLFEILGSGFVGIGKTPTRKLDISGGAAMDSLTVTKLEVGSFTSAGTFPCTLGPYDKNASYLRTGTAIYSILGPVVFLTLPMCTLTTMPIDTLFLWGIPDVIEPITPKMISATLGLAGGTANGCIITDTTATASITGSKKWMVRGFGTSNSTKSFSLQGFLARTQVIYTKD